VICCAASRYEKCMAGRISTEARMLALLNRMAPGATDMIRADHARVLALFHRYDIDASPRRKQALVEAVCAALEIHAQMEEDVFYPALRAAGSDLVEKALPEHEEMRRLIATLREMDPAILEYDATFMDLMREVMHHVADEETAMLPHAEVLLSRQLGELGARMTRRRMQLMAAGAPRAVEKVKNLPGGPLLWAAGAIVAGVLLFRNRR
jgi:hypothetical protein